MFGVAVLREGWWFGFVFFLKPVCEVVRDDGCGLGFFTFLGGFWRDLSCKDFISVCYLFLIMI